jgi:hypothetical protein
MGIIVKSKSGAKTKLTKEIIDIAKQYISVGTPVIHVCNALTITEPTWYGWFNKGEDIYNNETLTDEEREKDLYFKFFKVVKKAKADLIARNLQIIEKAAETGNWTAAAWKLERLDYENFGKKEKLEHSGHTVHTLTSANTDELIEKAKELGMTDEEIKNIMGG